MSEFENRVDIAADQFYGDSLWDDSVASDSWDNFLSAITAAHRADMKAMLESIRLTKRPQNTQEYRNWPDVTNGYNEAVSELDDAIAGLGD